MKFNLYLWDVCGEAGTITNKENWDDTSITPTAVNQYGPYWILDIVGEASADGCVNVIIRDADKNKLIDPNQLLKWTADDRSIAISAKRKESYASTKEAFEDLYSAAAGFEVETASAHWITKDLLVWKDAEKYKVRLQYDLNPIEVKDDQLTGKFVNLTETTVPDDIKAKYPTLGGYKAFQVPNDSIDIKQALKGEVLVVGLDGNNNVKAQSKVQTAKVIDDVYVTDDLLKVTDLGATVTDSGVTFKVWAPTAQTVHVHIWPQAGTGNWDDIGADMTEDPATGIWSYTSADAKADGNAAYKYQLSVYHPSNRKINDTWATDPYSLSILSGNSAIVNLDDTQATPTGWESVKAPHSQATEADISAMLITESHIRDLTVGTDKGITDDNQGKYLGLTELSSNVGKHLKDLADAGVTHIEFLPLYDIASIDENNVFDKKTLDVTISGAEFCTRADKSKTDGVDVCGSSELVYDLLAKAAAEDSEKDANVDKFLSTYVKTNDSYNWGYDPWHYQVPEGSYATDIKDPYARINEIRTMFQSVKNDYGMNIILDVVYNHTDGSGLEKESSVLDRLVPWYYNRLDPVSGDVIHDTCCEDSAAEHKMFAKLMEDTLVTWAKDYKVDAFRFDLMGYIPKQVMIDTLKNVKSRSGNNEIYFFGEGWDTGSASAALGYENTSTQRTMNGTGIGTFNDRIRDGVRGSGPFDHGDALINKQGFASGRCSEVNSDSADGCDDVAKNFQDIIRISMAGNLRDYELETYKGVIKTGAEIDYWGNIAGYGDKPIDTINYVSKHDNQTLFDLIMYKAKSTNSMENKARMQGIGLATAILGQSPAFDQQGSDLLRTKYFQNDSYNTGDFSNKVNYDSTKGNEFIPGAIVNKEKDSADWDAITKVGKYNTDVGADVKAKMVDTYKALATIRRDNDALHLGTADLIKSNVKFLNTGTAQKNGLIVMHTKKASGTNGADEVVVMLNAIPEETSFDTSISGLKAENTGKLYQDSCSVSGSSIKAKAWSVCVFTK